MRIDVITLFPDFVEGCARVGVVGRACERGLIEIATWNPRDFASDNYRSADDRCYGGGPGVVMMIDPLARALASARAASGSSEGKAIYLSPQGRRLDQAKVEALARRDHLILLCGRYEGVDERFIEHAVEEEISVGDYVLSGGELAAAIIIDAVGRLQEGVLHDAQSALQDSFANGLLDCPHYTRPERHAWGVVPAVLTSGDHAAIARWRLKQSLGRTWLRRPDLLAQLELDDRQRALLDEFRREHEAKTTRDRDSGSGE
ncbi:MAG: tRNA (guanosine(37)-N1)-methyltransferase TrmD [Dokdonella sp.]|uniref:tRNA (guanosine(37)-N1)-methyltransferase TrmD n=1 Tax=Dokdonella sp. TaxID=2291710 RepID=UPI0025B8EE8E|nr:tRNA (guanosine(37)-N1)-methyltransferase TrmD [Dokdonella sp.]MBX3699608.1 tRNA (guanosine(37)-N1)-methyltransferase TrmD [Dokdonella sp.]MCW5577361.1 tRNA (guanosine(37)-N1)-methyltransferase TrmD [Dokdonella sp.]